MRSLLLGTAAITDPRTVKPYPPTAQHAVKEGNVAANNL